MSYFEEYDEMFSEPSKAEQIIEDAKAALWNELTEEVKQLMDDANEAKTKADEIRREVSSLNWQKAQLEEEIKQLGHKIMELYDEELIANQDEERYLSALKKDIEEFKEKKRTIVSYVPSSSVDVETFTKDGYDWARLYCIYGIKQDGLLYNSNIVFILKKDENSHYKIYGWKLVQKDN